MPAEWLPQAVRSGDDVVPELATKLQTPQPRLNTRTSPFFFTLLETPPLLQKLPAVPLIYLHSTHDLLRSSFARDDAAVGPGSAPKRTENNQWPRVCARGFASLASGLEKAATTCAMRAVDAVRSALKDAVTAVQAVARRASRSARALESAASNRVFS